MSVVAAWSQNTAYSLGDIRRPSLTPVDGLFFKVTTLFLQNQPLKCYFNWIRVTPLKTAS